MEKNETFLKDFIQDSPEIQKFADECDQIADKANSLASKNIASY